MKLVSISALSTALVAGAATATAEPAYGPPQDELNPAVTYSFQHPGTLPIGMNDTECTPSAAHPRPVVLLNGAFLDKYANWAELAPRLAAQGYCVFGLDYGARGPLHQTGNLRDSAAQISAFVDRVLAATGAREVDLVGYSEGALVALHYLNVLGGDRRVGTLISLSGPLLGMSSHGMTRMIASLPGGLAAYGQLLPSAADAATGSSFLAETAAGGLTRPTVRYVTISSRADLIVDADESRLPEGPEVTNLVVQDLCATSRVQHEGVVYDDFTLSLVTHGLDPRSAPEPRCTV
ncbi:esterase/lipase family protein [Nocardia sp. NPDC127579]|uniref:esterase/lipase family protein n=1 Tax=Nocardia sp. NPDC127579 TaxID=3345402 RepID=UPI00364500CC